MIGPARKARIVPALVALALAAAGCKEPQRQVASAPTTPSTPPVEEDNEAFRRTIPPKGVPGKVAYPVARVTRLDNGLSIYFVPRPSGLVSLSLVVRGGGNALAAGQSGLAAFSVRMMTEATKNRNALALARDVEALGSELTHDAGRDHASVGLTTLAEDFDRAMGLLSDVVLHPAFDAADTARVRTEWLTALEAERQEPTRLSSLAGFRLLYGPRLGAPVSGSRKDVARFGVADLRRFHRDRFVPGSAALVVAGTVSPEAVEAAAKRYFGAWPARAGAAEPKPDLPAAVPGRPLFLIDRPGSVQSALFVATRSEPRQAPGYEARAVFNDVVGGLFTSRLNTNLRETHAYTYGARSALVATRSWGAFVVMTSVRTDVTADALKEIFAELQAATARSGGRPLSPEELSRGRADLVQGAAQSLQGTASVRDEFEELFVHELGPDYLARYPALIEGATAADVQKAGEALAPDGYVIVVVGDAAKVKAPLEAQGYSVEVADPALTD